MTIPDLELMLFADGELEPERARRVRLARLQNLDVSARLEGIERVGDFVRVWAARDRAAAEASRLEAIRFDRRRRSFATAVLALAVLAVSAEPVHTPAGFELALVASPAGAPHQAVAIEAIDFGTGAGSVFLVETGASVTPVIWLDDGARSGG